MAELIPHAFLLKRLWNFAAYLVILISIVVISGWIFDVEVLKSFIPTLVLILLAGLIWISARVIDHVDAERKQAEIALRNNEERTRLIVDKAHDAYVGINAAGEITGWNSSAETIFGWSRSEVLGKNVADVVIPPEYREAHLRGMAHFLATGEGPVLNKQIEMPALRKNGHRFPVELTISAVHSNDTYQFNAFIRDITERKTAEEKILQLTQDLHARAKQLEAANKELESFSYSVSHDLRAPLRAIDGFSRVLMESHSNQLDPEALRVLGIVRSNTQRMGQLIDDLLNFSRIGRKEIKRSTINMSELANEILEEIKAEYPQRVLQFQPKGILPAYGDHQMIRQVLFNLLSNAFKFTKSKEATVIEIGSTANGAQNIYFVKDNGVGFDMNYSNKLFGVFQRLHSVAEFEGTGVGLAIVHRVIERHGGRVWAEAELNNGATFYFTLPGEGINE